MKVTDLNEEKARRGTLPKPTGANGAVAMNGAARVGWDDPIPLKSPSPCVERPFPTDALPLAFANFTRGLADQMQVPEALVAGSVLTMLSASVQGSWVVHAVQDWREPVSMYWCLCAEPADKKSPVFSRCSKPIIKWETEETKRTHSARARSVTKRKVLEANAASAAKRATKSGDELDMQEATQALEDLEKHVVLSAPRVFAQDVTAEKLAVMLAEQHGRLSILDTEGGIFETMAGRYSDGVPNIDVFLKGHAGEPVRIDRKNGTSINIDKANVTIGLMVQPDVIRELATKPGFRGRGLLARFQYVIPQSLMSRRVSRSPTLDPEARKAYEQVIESALNWGSNNKNEDGGWKVTEIPMTDEVKEMFHDLADKIEPELGQGGRLNPIQDWAGKWGGVVVRLSGLLALAEYFERFPVYPATGIAVSNIIDDSFFDENPAPRPVVTVERRHFESARKIGEYLMDSALVAFSAVMGQTDQALAERAIGLLKRLKMLEISKRDLLRGLRVKAALLDPAIEALEQHGYLKRVDARDRAAVSWQVNPALLT